MQVKTLKRNAAEASMTAAVEESKKMIELRKEVCV
jgi:hypothetical protein